MPEPDITIVGGDGVARQYLQELQSRDVIAGLVGKPDQSIDTATTPNQQAKQLVDLQPLPEGYRLTVRNDTLTTIKTSVLVFTTPAVVDLLPEEETLEGADSAVAGLLIERLETPPEQPSAWLENPHDASTGGFPNPREDVFTAGALNPDPSDPDVDQLLAATRNRTAPEPDEDQPEFEDVDLPEGFVETKTNTLCSLLDECRRFNPERDSRQQLLQRLEGLAGEVDSYSRFRPDPDLLRLRWKTLLGMNLVRPLFQQSAHG